LTAFDRKNHPKKTCLKFSKSIRDLFKLLLEHYPTKNFLFLFTYKRLELTCKNLRIYVLYPSRKISKWFILTEIRNSESSQNFLLESKNPLSRTLGFTEYPLKFEKIMWTVVDGHNYPRGHFPKFPKTIPYLFNY
jgi:hypothetical protein